jgi:DNA repair exonuclease SbcCD ATPase subunit
MQMKNINFKKVTIKNFLSVGNQPVVIEFKPGLHIITGLNKDKEDRRNGVGKSTVADAVYFAVFGETLRDLKKEFIVNNINKKNCEVSIEVEIKHFDKTENIQIIRTLEPSKCYLYINGEDKTRDSISNTNEFIREKFNCTPEVFQNCVIMTINNTIPFMAKKKQEKRKFIEDIFNLGIFGQMLTILKTDANDKKKTFDIETAKFDEATKTLGSYEKQKEAAAQEKTRKLEKYKARKTDNAAEILIIEKQLLAFEVQSIDKINSEIEGIEKNLTKLDTKLQNTRHNISENSTLITQLEKKLNSVGTDKDKCPVCLRGIEEIDKKHIREEKQTIKKEIEERKTSIKTFTDEETLIKAAQIKLNNNITDLKNNIHNYNLKLQDKANITTRLEQLQKWQIELDQDLTDLDTQSNSFDSIIDEQRKRLTNIQASIDEINQVMNMLEVVKFVVSEEGVKSYIVKKILQLFNSKLTYYLKKMDANCVCSFNEYFEEEIVDDKGKQSSYFNFSGAERKNIDLSCLFTFMDIRRLQGDVSFNFSIYDELFDSSLDEKGVELVIGILKERVEKYNECIMVISHRKESIKAATGDIIFLEKNNGITRRVDYIEYKS